jgi:hypothetical protein
MSPDLSRTQMDAARDPLGGCVRQVCIYFRGEACSQPYFALDFVFRQ